MHLVIVRIGLIREILQAHGLHATHAGFGMHTGFCQDRLGLQATHARFGMHTGYCHDRLRTGSQFMQAQGLHATHARFGMHTG